MRQLVDQAVVQVRKASEDSATWTVDLEGDDGGQ